MLFKCHLNMIIVSPGLIDFLTDDPCHNEEFKAITVP